MAVLGNGEGGLFPAEIHDQKAAGEERPKVGSKIPRLSVLTLGCCRRRRGDGGAARRVSVECGEVGRKTIVLAGRLLISEKGLAGGESRLASAGRAPWTMLGDQELNSVGCTRNRQQALPFGAPVPSGRPAAPSRQRLATRALHLQHPAITPRSSTRFTLHTPRLFALARLLSLFVCVSLHHRRRPARTALRPWPDERASQQSFVSL